MAFWWIFCIVWRCGVLEQKKISGVKILRKILISSYHVIERENGSFVTYLEFSIVSLSDSKCQKTRLWTPYFGVFRHFFTEKRHSRTDPTDQYQAQFIEKGNESGTHTSREALLFWWVQNFSRDTSSDLVQIRKYPGSSREYLKAAWVDMVSHSSQGVV